MAAGRELRRPITVLIDELKSEDIQVRLSTIAGAIGEDSYRNELIPFLNNSNNQEDVLLAMAEELGMFIPYVGGVDHAHVLLPPLEALCTVENNCIWDTAVKSLEFIGYQMKNIDVVAWFVPVIKRLAAGEWFTARVSSCGLLPIAYPSEPESLKSELMTFYGQLCQDDMPMVRRAAASNLGIFAATVEPSYLKTEIVSIFKNLALDDRDWVRLFAVQECDTFWKLLGPQDRVAQILPVIVNFSQDISWRVRYNSGRTRYIIANEILNLCETLGPETTRVDLTPVYVRLLRDDAAEVRIAAAGNVAMFCHILNPQLTIDHILPCVKELSADCSQHVRSSLASVIVDMAPILGKDANFLLFAQGRSPGCSFKLDQLNKVTGIDVLSQSLLPAILELPEDRNWRARLTIIEYIPLLASLLGAGFFDHRFSDFCLYGIEDKVYSIREAAAKNLKPLVEKLGPDRTMHNIVPRVLEKISNPNYLYRMTILQAVSLLVPVMGAEIIRDLRKILEISIYYIHEG